MNSDDEEEQARFEQQRPLSECVDLKPYLDGHTVAVGVLPARRGAQPDEEGSGVLVRLLGRAFVFTAGHVLTEIRERVMLAIAREDQVHRFDPLVVTHGFAYEKSTPVDSGFIEICATDAATMEAKAKVFLCESKLEVFQPEDLTRHWEWLLLTGFPAAVHRRNIQRPGFDATALRMAMVHAAPPSESSVPQSILTPGRGGPYVDLVVAQTHRLIADDGAYLPRLPDLHGMSGGGCWKPHLPRDPAASWQPARCSLIGTLSSGTTARRGDQHPSAFRVSLIAQHLKLLADQRAELRSHIYNTWPVLEYL